MSILAELWDFLRVRKKFWLMPIVIVLLVFGGLVILVQQAGRRIAREVFRQPGNRVPGALSHPGCPFWRELFQLFKSFPQAHGVEHIYSEHSDTTL